MGRQFRLPVEVTTHPEKEVRFTWCKTAAATFTKWVDPGHSMYVPKA
jgi:hypothetical protein